MSYGNLVNAFFRKEAWGKGVWEGVRGCEGVLKRAQMSGILRGNRGSAQSTTPMVGLLTFQVADSGYSSRGAGG